MNSCGDSTFSSSSSNIRSTATEAATNMITLQGLNNTNNSYHTSINNNDNTTMALPISSSNYTRRRETEEQYFENYSSASDLSSLHPHTLTAPPPSPQDPSPLDALFSQHLTSKLQQAVIYTNGNSTNNNINKLSTTPSAHRHPTSSSSTITLATLFPEYNTANNMDKVGVPLSTSPTNTSLNAEQLLPAVMIPGALPLSCTTTYGHHHYASSNNAANNRQGGGVDPQQLDFLLRRVSRIRKQYPNSHQRHSQRSNTQSQLQQSASNTGTCRATKRIGGFYKRPSRIPLYSKRLQKQQKQSNNKGFRMDQDNTEEQQEQQKHTSLATLSWKENAKRQKQEAISTAVKNWQQLKQYRQDLMTDINNGNDILFSNINSNNPTTALKNIKTQEEVDRIVHDLQDMGL
ncbi:uncharacterized protein BX664DRAFT_343077 [Halteromyces radiatus]|uniref:uncharacterized protein n=1 Tax=Halteromyces radiatus TaxID=101107 RepID=UPI00221F45A6|nr:uncharacterized protein BX664DRAFT_343077 [Halteromyces radiatus]KAI8078916.1 hypothetical protein BX664DRAFT_343077 [Halteromyces radiatus]